MDGSTVEHTEQRLADTMPAIHDRCLATADEYGTRATTSPGRISSVLPRLPTPCWHPGAVIVLRFVGLVGVIGWEGRRRGGAERHLRMMGTGHTVKTAPGAIAVQIMWSSRRGSRPIEHLGSAYDEAGAEALKAAAQQQLAGAKVYSTGAWVQTAPAEVGRSSRAGHLWDALCRAHQALGFDRALDGDEVLRYLVLARIIEPTSKADALPVLAETGAVSFS